MRNIKNKKYQRKKIFTTCFMVNIQDAINYDIGFINFEEIKNSWISTNQNIITSTYTYSMVDRETLHESELIEGVAYRARLQGIISSETYRGKKYENIQKKRAKRMIIDVNKDTGGIFLCCISSVDKHNRILIDLYHPVTGMSMCDLILEKYGDIYKKF